MATRPGASGTYQQSGPSAPQAARAVLAELGAQASSFGALPAYLKTNSPNPNSGILIQAKASGSGAEAITVAFVAAGANTPLSIGVVGNAITVNLATNAASAPASTAREVVNALNTTAAANALVSAVVNEGDGSGIVAAFAATALAGDANPTIGKQGNAPLPKQHPSANAYA